MYGKIELVYTSLLTMLRVVLRGNQKSWDEYLPYIEICL